jgi:hypothetical protein
MSTALLAGGAILMLMLSSGKKRGQQNPTTTGGFEYDPTCDVMILDDASDWSQVWSDGKECLVVIVAPNANTLAALVEAPNNCGALYVTDNPEWVLPNPGTSVVRVYTKTATSDARIVYETELTQSDVDLGRVRQAAMVCSSMNEERYGFAKQPQPGSLYKIESGDTLRDIIKRALPTHSNAERRQYEDVMQRSAHNWALYATAAHGQYPNVTVNGRKGNIRAAFKVMNDPVQMRAAQGQLPAPGVRFELSNGETKLRGLRIRRYGSLHFPQLGKDGQVVEWSAEAPESLPMRLYGALGVSAESALSQMDENNLL